jgi:hypothetical protein
MDLLVLLVHEWLQLLKCRNDALDFVAGHRRNRERSAREDDGRLAHAGARWVNRSTLQ